MNNFVASSNSIAAVYVGLSPIIFMFTVIRPTQMFEICKKKYKHKEAIWERVEQPSLAQPQRGARFSLSNTWDRVLRRFPRRLSRDPSGSLDL